MWQSWKARAQEAVKGGVERLAQARRGYADPIPLGDEALGAPQPSAASGASLGGLLEPPDPVLEHLLRKARSPEVLEQFLLIPEENYTAQHQVKLLAATYNVNGRPPPEGLDLLPWLGGGRYADIVAVGFQEIVPLNATNIVLGATMDAALAWDAHVAAALNSAPSTPSGASGSDKEAGAAAPGGASGEEGGSGGAEAGRGGSSVDELLGLGPAAADAAGPGDGEADLLGLSLEDPPPAASAAGGGSVGDAGSAPASPAAGTAEAGGGDPAQQEATGDSGSSSGSEEGAVGGGASGNGAAAAAGPAAGPLAAGARAIEASQDPNAFVQVAGKQMVGVYLSVWARRSQLPHIRGVQVASVATGALGYFGNKGAVAVRLRVFDAGFCFINAHLSSGEAEGDEQRRNYDYAEILRRGFFPPEDQSAQQVAAAEAQGVSKVLRNEPGHWGSALHILDCEHTIWVGDLNYRLQGLAAPDVLAAIQAGELESLLAADQLRLAMRARQAFHGWQERAIAFPPTFKLKRGTAQYLGEASGSSNDLGGGGAGSGGNGGGAGSGGNGGGGGSGGNGGGGSSHPSSADLKSLQDVIQDEASSMTLTASQAAFDADASKGSSSSARASGPGATPTLGAKPGEREKARTPAWTDRILWRCAGPGGALQQLSYTAAQGVTVSDHFPVSAAFIARAREYGREQVDAALEVARRVADAREMAAVPHCTAQPSSLELGALEYGEVLELPVCLANTAQAPAHFRFVPVPGERRPLPSWLSAHPTQGCVPVGGSATLLLRACVAGGPGGAAEAVLAEQRSSLDCILVLRVEGGNDIFLCLSGHYVPSCFGLSWPTLAALPRPVATSGGLKPQPSAGVGPGRLEVGGDTFFDPLHSISRVPQELVRLTDFLRHGAWLATPGLFVKASDLATAAAARRLGRLGSTLSDGGGGGGGGHFLAQAPRSPVSNPGGVGVGSPRAQRGRPAQPAEAAGLLRFNSGGTGASAGGIWGAAAEGQQASPSGSGSEATSFADAVGSPLGSSGGSGSLMGAASEAPTSPIASHRQAALLAVRRALDRGEPFPESADAHDAAAALLAFFAELPQPFVPDAVVEVCDVCVPQPSTAAPLVIESMSATELAVLCHVLLLLGEVLAPENRAHNGLSPASLAAILAEVWFPALPSPSHAAAAVAAAAPGGGGATASVAEVSMRRIEFVTMLLEQPAVLQTLCAAL